MTLSETGTTATVLPEAGTAKHEYKREGADYLIRSINTIIHSPSTEILVILHSAAKIS